MRVNALQKQRFQIQNKGLLFNKELSKIEVDSKRKKFSALGNRRWTRDLLLSTWYQSQHAKPPPVSSSLEYKVGESNGGFDNWRFNFENNTEESVWDDYNITRDLSITLNKKIKIDMPTYGGGMSYGSVSLSVMLARALSSKLANSYTSTGEGGYPIELEMYKNHVITQVATGLFGVNEKTLQNTPIIELKYAQGAKPGLGGHLLGDKNTVSVSNMRESVQSVSLFSPFPFHSVYSVEDHKSHVEWLKTINPKALISVKVATPHDIEMVAIGAYYAGADIIHIDGAYGGTGAAPEIAKKNIAMPLEYAIPIVHEYLTKEGVRDEITLIASGGVRTAYDVSKSIAIGADGVVRGSSELIPLGCTQCGNCESGRGCQVGIATTDEYLSQIIDPNWGSERISNLDQSWKLQYDYILSRLNLKNFKELRGNYEVLQNVGKKNE
jgi:glutamate synthase domain-containing protein 2